MNARIIKLALIPALILAYMLFLFAFFDASSALIKYLKIFSAVSLPAFYLGLFVGRQKLQEKFVDYMGPFNYLLTLVFLYASLPFVRRASLNNFASASRLMVGYTAGILAVYNLFVILRGSKTISHHSSNLILLIIQFYIIVASGTRGALLSFVMVAFIMILIYSKNKRTIFTTIVVLLILGFSVQIILTFSPLRAPFVSGLNRVERALSISAIRRSEVGGERKALYINAWNNWLKNPIIGTGTGQAEYLPGGYQGYPHNLFLEVLAEYGLMGFSLLVIFLAKFFHRQLLFIKGNYKTLSLLGFFVLFRLGGLQLSSSFLLDSQLWFLVGVFFASEMGLLE